MNKRKLIVVLGMHRSGTSAITRGLQVLGVGLGSQLHSAASDNPKGFWEDKDCLAINERLLRLLGSAYDRLTVSWTDIENLDGIEEIRAEATEIIKKKIDDNDGIWGFKDPRTCRLLNFWQTVFDNVECDVSYVLVVRNPVSVADSLYKRNNLPASKSHILWLQHMLPVVRQTSESQRVFVDYDNLMKAPFEQIERIAKNLLLEVPKQDSAEMNSFQNDFLDSTLRHSIYTEQDMENDESIPSVVKKMYRILQHAAGDSNANEQLSNVENLEFQLKSFEPAFLYVNDLEDERQTLWKKISDYDIAIEQYHEMIKNEEEKFNILNQDYNLILNSLSWKLTKPLRYIRRAITEARFDLYSEKLSSLIRDVWHNLPVDTEKKIRAKGYLFEKMPLLFSKTAAYKAWYNMNNPGHSMWADDQLSSNFALKFHEKDCYVPITTAEEPKDVPVNLIAFYLPQFHAIKENNEWWGEGFTEWTNVKPAVPQFEGHYQPHVPGELGYYNLLDSDVQRRQIELAKLYGVGGFCFYYYWFGGKRLLEQPIENYLNDNTLDHPFCLCWANENWSRRWDGLDSQILIAQDHSPEDDLAFAEDVARYMRDSRYIRVDGKPLLVVYRPSLLPSALETSERWREFFRNAGLGEVYLAYTQSFETEDPRKYGFDAAIEFPPNNSNPPNITNKVKPADKSFSGNVFDWSVFLERSEKYKNKSYRLFRSVCPSWDNTARRKNNGTIFANSDPADYQKWLENAIEDTCKNIEPQSERLVFVNAWNEWAEGAHLEPDQKYGYAWLDATRKALTGEVDTKSRTQIAVVSHDAHPHGAQFLALGMVRSLVNELKFDVHTVLLGEGRLKEQFEQYSSVYELFPGENYSARAEQLAQRLKKQGISCAIVNTTVSGSFIRVLSEQGVNCVSLIHEMPELIKANNLIEHTRNIAKSAHKVIFPAEVVAEGFQNFASIDEANQIIRPQGLWRRNLKRFNKPHIRHEVRAKLGVKEESPLVLAVGYADHRKGIDLFARSAMEVLKHKPDTTFVWIGHWDEALRDGVNQLIKGKEESFKFLGYQPETASFHAAADVYALTSREDPFPNVVLESFDAGVPVVAFSKTGGGSDLVSSVGGIVVPQECTDEFGLAVVNLLDAPETTKKLGQEASDLVDREYDFRSYLFDVCSYVGIDLPKISVVVPNYNYARYIRQRLDSILNQTLPIYELIILDDASTDESLKEITDWLTENKIECRLVVNEKNSGCVFDQWAKGIDLATGDYIWIAEADDLSAPEFLETALLPMQQDPLVNISYCESLQINEHGRYLSLSYKDYYKDICHEHWSMPYISDGRDEVSKYLAIKNTIPNVSGVIFRRDHLAESFEKNQGAISALKKAGDWLVYINVMLEGKVAFSPRPMNLHRRHSNSVIGGSGTKSLINEIATVQGIVAKQFTLSEAVVDKASKYLCQLESKLTKE